MYFAGVNYLYGKEIVGFSLLPCMDADLVLTALHRTFHEHRALPELILRSDCGSQYSRCVYVRIEIFYNRQRRQEVFGYLSPVAFAKKVHSEQIDKAA